MRCVSFKIAVGPMFSAVATRLPMLALLAVATGCGLIGKPTEKVSLPLTRQTLSKLSLPDDADQYCYAIHHWGVRAELEYQMPLPPATCPNTPHALGKVYGFKSVGDTVEFEALLGRAQHFDLIAVPKAILPGETCAGVLSIEAQNDSIKTFVDGADAGDLYPVLLATATRDVIAGDNSIALNSLPVPDVNYQCVEEPSFLGPTVTQIVASSGNYGVGNPIDITVDFSESVVVDGLPALLLSLNSGLVLANYQSQSAGTKVHFKYWPTVNDESTDDVEVIGFSLGANDRIYSSANNLDADFGIDTIALTGVTIAPLAGLFYSSPTSDVAWFGPHDSIEIRLNFGQTVNLVGGNPDLFLANGATAYYTGLSADGQALKFLYTVAAANADNTDLEVSSYNSNGSIVRDALNNAILIDATTLPTPSSSDPRSLSYAHNFKIDAHAPNILSPNTITAAPDSASVASLTHSPVINLLPALPNDGYSPIVSAWVSIGTPGIPNQNLDQILVSPISLSIASLPLATHFVNGVIYQATIVLVDEAGNESNPIVSSTWTADATSPTITSVTTSNSNSPWYKAGDTITIFVNFNEPVVVAGYVQLDINSHGGAFANFFSGSGTSILTFQYTVVNGDDVQPLDALSITGGGTIKDAAQNIAVLTMPASPGLRLSNAALRLDARAPNAVPSLTLNVPVLDDLGRVQVTYTAATDQGLSGIAGYQYAVGSSSNATDIRDWTTPPGGVPFDAVSLPITALGQQYWVSMRAVDNAGNNSSIFSQPWTTWNGGTWSAVNSTGAPGGRSFASAAWDSSTSRFFIWGGWNMSPLNTGGFYAPGGAGTWTASSTINAPTGRQSARLYADPNRGFIYLAGGEGGPYSGYKKISTGGAGTWTSYSTPIALGEITFIPSGTYPGSDWIDVWGGSGSQNFMGTSLSAPIGFNNPPPGGTALSARKEHTATVVGASNDRAFIFGGYAYSDGSPLNDGSQVTLSNSTFIGGYSSTDAPSARGHHAAVRIASEKVLIWGGRDGTTQCFNSGAIYDTSNNTWTAIPNAPLSGRYGFAYTWTGSRFIVWGGGCDLGGGGQFGDGAVYNPASNTWAPLASSSLSTRRGPAFSGQPGTNKLFVFGGENPTVQSDGAIFDLGF
jgi:hypothetical protein